MPQPKGIPVAPLTGILDTRSLPDLLPQGALRWRQNFQTTGDGKLRRGCGWTKALTKSDYNNQDFHDQLLLFGGTVREPVTSLFEFQSSRGIRSLWLTTQSRIAKLDEMTGNWKIIASGLGGGAGADCSGPRFKAANVGDYVAFTNGHDRPKIHRLEQPPFDDALIADIPDLEVIGLSKAALAFEWKGILIFADVEMDGQRFPNRFVWSNLDDPQSFDPAKPESIAGYADLNYGERILNGGRTTAGTFLLYTTQGIWELAAVNDDRVFTRREAYPGAKCDFVGCLKYENSLVDIGGDHLFMAKDGIYAFSPYRSAPELVLWLHRSTSVLFDDIDDTACQASIGWFHDGEAFWSVKRNSDAGCPGITLRVETQFKVADTIDRGFTAAVNYRPQPIATIRDFILDYRICTLPCLTAALVAAGLPPPFENEGMPSPVAEPSAPFVPLYFYTSITQTIGDVVTEDWNQPNPSPDSLCALLGDITIDDLCRACEAVSVLIAASSQDWCLKQFGGFYRERCVNTADVGVAVECDETCDETPSDPCADVSPLAIVTTELDVAVEGEAYSFQMEASGGSGDYSWSITSGTLPTGLTMDSTGLITGTPTVSGDVELEFTLSDTTCEITDATLALTISVTDDICGPKPPVSLLAYYNCDDAAYPVLDSVGGKNLTYMLGDPFPSVEPGIIGTGFFNGVGGVPRFTMGNTDAQWELTGEEAFTIRAWFWYSGDFSTLANVSVGVQGRVLIQMFDPLLGPYFKFVVQASESFTHSHYAAIGESGWHRVVAVFRKGCGTLLKVDNNESNFFPFENPLEVFAGGDTFILDNLASIPGYPKSGIDEVGIWRGAWTEAQMLDDWNSGLGKTYPNVPDGPNLFVDNLAAYYACEESSASTFLADSTGAHDVPTFGSGLVLTAAGIIGTALQIPPGTSNPKFRMAASGPWGVFPGDFAVRLWVYIDISVSNIFIQGPFWYIEHVADVIRFHIDGDPSGDYTILSPAVTGGAWHRIVVWNRTGIELGMKIDNDSNVTPVAAPNQMFQGNGRLVVSDTNAITDSRIDEIAIWDGYIPTAYELLNDWNGGAGRTYPLT